MTQSADAQLGRSVAIGAAWTIGSRWLMRSAGLINIILLARLVPASDFGLIGLAVAFLGAFEALSDMSLIAALVRHPNPQRAHYDTVFTFQIIRGAFLAAIAALCAQPLAAWYEEPRLALIIYALAAQMLIYGFVNPGVADFLRSMNFRRDFIYMAVRKLAGVGACMALALTIWPDWRALIANLLVGAAALTVASYALHPYRPRLSLAAAGELFSFSKWMVVGNLLVFMRRRVGHFILPKIVGAHGLGLFTLAQELSNMVTTEIALPAQRALLPGFSRSQNDAAVLRSHFTRGLGMLAAICAPLVVGMAMTAESLVRLAYGADKLGAAEPMTVLAFYGAASILGVYVEPLVIALGQPRKLQMANLATMLMVAGGVLWFAPIWGLIGAAAAIAFAEGAYGIWATTIAARMTGVSLRAILSELWRPILAVAAMAVCVHWAQSLAPAPETSGAAAIRLGLSVLAGGLSYPAALLAVWRASGRPKGAESTLFSLVKKRPAAAG